MSIDTDIPGDPDQIREAADWLDPTAKGAVDDATADVHMSFQGSYGHWFSLSGESYRSTLSLLVEAGDDVASLCGDVAEKLRSYAGQLERMAGHFADHRDRARTSGIPVSDKTINPPVSTVPYCPADEDDPRWEEWEAHLERVETFNDIADDVGTRWGELEKWIEENLTAFIIGVPTTPASDLIAALKEGNESLLTTYVDGTTRQWERNVLDLQNQSTDLAEAAKEFKRELRSGNPAVKAAAAAANPSGMKVDAEELADAARRLGRAGKVLPIVGPVLDVVLAGSDIAQGDSPSSVGIELVGGVAGGALAVGALALAGVTLPVWGTAAVVGGAALAVGWGAKWAYEEIVPQDVREAIDAGIRDTASGAWDATTDFAEDAWDATSGAVEGAWNWAFG
ncbi:hypothetical protein [Serinibacter arcticus]|uniref:WXG100 family type VII secretion target n=1 Tax=Serinibacter arcticus TaxID=1655435 RepID=A0A4Z1E6P4_9MICO|nr:hypothetical protein [Serinibacter arcticus]TGO05261.1 hypothetical protein SERN_1265 [Serinibacter arcticus]